MARKECVDFLLESGLFGEKESEEAQEMANRIVDTIVNDNALYNADGSLNVSAASESFDALVKRHSVIHRKEAIRQYYMSESAKKLNEKFDLVRQQYKDSTGKDLTVDQQFQADMYGLNLGEDVTGTGISADALIQQTKMNMYSAVQDGLDKIFLDHGEQAKAYIGYQQNIFKDAGVGLKQFTDENFIQARTELFENILLYMEGSKKVNDPLARDLAKLFQATYFNGATRINKFGGNIELMENYNPHIHDAEKIVLAEPDEWITAIKQELDLKETYKEEYNKHMAKMELTKEKIPFEETEVVDELLLQSYRNIVQGKHNEFGYQAKTYKGKVKPSIVFERQRKFEFKSPEAYLRYAKSFGTLDHFDVLERTVDKMAVTASLMEKYGPYPEETLARMRDIEIQKMWDRGEPRKKIRDTQRALDGDIGKGEGKIGGRYANLTGTMNVPINSNVANFFSGWRALKRSLLKFAGFSDFFGNMSTRTIQTKNIKGSNNPFEIIHTVLSTFDWRDKEFVELLGLMGDEWTNSAYYRYIGDETQPDTVRLINKINAFGFRINGMGKSQRINREAAQLSHMSILGNQSNLPYNELPRSGISDMKKFNLFQGEWDLLREKAVKSEKTGKTYLYPNLLDKTTDAEIEPFIPAMYKEQNRPTVDVAKIRQFKREIDQIEEARNYDDAIQLGTKLKNVDKRINDTVDKQEGLEAKYNNRFAEGKRKLERDYDFRIKRAKKDVEASISIGKIVDAEKRKKTSSLKSISKEIKTLNDRVERFEKVDDGLEEKYNKRFKSEKLSIELDYKNRRKKAEGAINLKYKTKETRAEKLKEVVAGLDQRMKDALREKTDATAKEFDAERKKVRGEIKDAKSKISIANDNLEYTRNIDVFEEARSLYKEQKEKIPQLVKERISELKGELEGKIRLLTDEIAKQFDDEKVSLEGTLVKLQHERVRRYKTYNKELEAVSARLSEKNKKKLKDLIDEEKLKVNVWDKGREKSFEDTRFDIKRRWMMYYTAADNFAVIQTDARQRHFASTGRRPGTVVNELIKGAAQFKAQSFTQMWHIFKDNRIFMSRSGLGLLNAALGFLGTSIVFGYGSMTARDLLRGKSPRPLDRLDTYLDALVYAGGFGLPWDIISNENRPFGNMMAAFGPVGSDIGEAIQAVQDTYQAIKEDKTDELPARIGKRALNVVKSMVPSSMWTEWFINHYLFWPTREALSPGSMRRHQQKLKKETGQEYFTRRP